MADEPTVRKVVKLLEEAGFPRSTVYRPNVGRDEGSTGFRTWSTRAREAPGVKFLAVAHYDKGQRWTDDRWTAHLEAARRMLMRYADVITAGGYVARLAFDRADPQVLVYKREVRSG